MIKKSSTCGWFACAAGVVATLAVAGVSVASQVGGAVRPDLSGRWQLNTQLSDDARQKVQTVGHGGEDTRGGGHGPGRHGGLGRIFGGLFGGGQAEDVHAQLEAVVVDAPTNFVLVQDDQKVVLTEPNGRVRTLPTNNRTVKVDGRDVRTRWESNRLVSESTVGNAKVIETYERSPSVRQLIVTARVDMQGQQLTVRRVYDAVAK